jgi:hypothetical protein
MNPVLTELGVGPARFPAEFDIAFVPSGFMLKFVLTSVVLCPGGEKNFIQVRGAQILWEIAVLESG